MNRIEFIARLRTLSACGDAVAWAEATPGTPEQLWRKCGRADWLLWLARSANTDRKLMVRAACACAETALVYVRPDAQLACLWAIDSARRWSRGEAEPGECQAAAYAAYAAAYAAYYAAYAAAVIDAADDAAYAAYAAYYAADAHSRALAVMAPLVRREIPWSAVAAGLRGEKGGGGV